MTDPTTPNQKPSRRDFLTGAGTGIAAAAMLPTAYAVAASKTTTTNIQDGAASARGAPSMETGNAGELHQHADAAHPTLTTNQGHGDLGR